MVGESASVRTDPATGEFELPTGPGTYTVEVLAYGYVTASAEVTIHSGQTATRDFELAAAGTGSLRGRRPGRGGRAAGGRGA